MCWNVEYANLSHVFIMHSVEHVRPPLRARGKVRAQYRWAYATYTLLPVQEIGQNQHEKGGGLIIRHGHIIRILSAAFASMCTEPCHHECQGSVFVVAVHATGGASCLIQILPVHCSCINF